MVKARDRIVAERAQRRAERLLVQEVAGLGRRARRREVGRLQPRVGGQLRRGSDDVPYQVLGGRKALLGEPDGRRRDRGEFHRAEASERCVEPRNLARHCDRQRTRTRQFLVDFAISHVHRGTGAHRRALAIVERVEAVRVGEVDEHEAAAADPARGRVGHAHGERGCGGGVDRVAAAAQDFDSGARGERVFRHHHRAMRFGGAGRNGRGAKRDNG